jgi:hypothetical protein
VPPLNSAVRRHGKVSATFRSEKSATLRLRVRLVKTTLGEVVAIDLASATSEEDLIRALGGALQFGGPNPFDNISTTVPQTRIAALALTGSRDRLLQRSGQGRHMGHEQGVPIPSSARIQKLGSPKCCCREPSGRFEWCAEHRRNRLEV